MEKTKNWQIEVSDNGIGIEEKYYNRIFKPFERLHGRSEYEGSGIGLAICKKVVHRHNGTITVQKKPAPRNNFCYHSPRNTKAKLKSSIRQLKTVGQFSEPSAHRRE